MKTDILDPVLEKQEKMEVWKRVLEKQLLRHHHQIKIQKISHTVLNKEKKVRNCIIYFPKECVRPILLKIISPTQLSIETFHGPIAKISRTPKWQPMTRLQRKNKEKEEVFVATGRSVPLVSRPQRVYPAYFVPWEWKTSYSEGILKLSMGQGE